MGNHMILSAIWDKSARNFFKGQPNCGQVQFVFFEKIISADLSQTAQEKSCNY